MEVCTSGALNLETSIQSRFRKQITIILQILKLGGDEMERIAKFMGHPERTPKEF